MFRHSATQAIVLKSRSIGEIHKSVTLLTPGDGIITAIAHGAKKMGSRLRSTTEAFCLSKAFLYFDPVRKTYKITDMRGLRLHVGIRQRLDRFYVASLWAEILIKSYAGGDQSVTAFALARDCLDLCDTVTTARVRALNCQFVWRYMGILGLAPDLSTCSNCGAALKTESALAVSQDTGGCLCERCADGSDETRPLPAGIRRYLLKTGDLGTSESLRVGLSRDLEMVLGAFLFDYAESSLDVRLNALASVRGI